MRQECPTLNLTSSLSRPTCNYNAPNSISDCGDKVFIVYDINVDNNNKVQAELFNNDNGKLITIKMLYGDTCFPYTNGGKASPCFHKFSVLDDNGINIARLRIFDKYLNIITSKLFRDYYSPGFSFNGGNFSEDGCMIAITYVYDSNIGKNFQKSVLRILDANNLNEITNYAYEGNTTLNAEFFSLLTNDIKKEYIILTSQCGRYDANNACPQSPSLLKILELKDKSIELISEIELPEYFNFDFNKKNDNTLLISIGTTLSSKICHTEYRMYKFKNDKLKIIQKKNYNTTIIPKFTQYNNFILMEQKNVNYSLIQFIKLNKKYCPNNGLCSLAYFIPNKSCINSSKNGDWVIISGAKSDCEKTKNIHLYKIHYNKI